MNNNVRETEYDPNAPIITMGNDIDKVTIYPHGNRVEIRTKINSHQAIDITPRLNVTEMGITPELRITKKHYIPLEDNPVYAEDLLHEFIKLYDKSAGIIEYDSPRIMKYFRNRVEDWRRNRELKSNNEKIQEG